MKPVDFDSIILAVLDGLEVEPGCDSLEESPEEDREQLARLANARVLRSVLRAHAALVHPHKGVPVRMSQLAGASRPAIEHARLWDCPTWAESSMPAEHVTAFNAARRSSVRIRESGYAANKFTRHWIGVYGSPGTVYIDQGGDFLGAFVGVLEAFAIPSKVAGSSAAWQHGVTQRHGATALGAACAAKSSQIRRAGYSPEQIVFGKSMTWLADLADLECPALPRHTLEGEVWKSTVMRVQRSQAYAGLAVSSRREFWLGQLVYIYTETRCRSRRVPEGKRWRGLGIVLAREQLRPRDPIASSHSDSSLRESLAPARTVEAINVRPGVPPCPSREKSQKMSPLPQKLKSYKRLILPTRILPEQGPPERQARTLVNQIQGVQTQARANDWRDDYHVTPHQMERFARALGG
eukprot:1359956-Amphidinium_carterae.4